MSFVKGRILTLFVAKIKERMGTNDEKVSFPRFPKFLIKAHI